VSLQPVFVEASYLKIIDPTQPPTPLPEKFTCGAFTHGVGELS